MENFPKDILVLFALDLELPELLNYCRTNKKINDKICQNDSFWLMKLKREFPNIVPDNNRSFKNQYLEIINSFPGFTYKNGKFDKDLRNKLISEGLIPVNAPLSQEENRETIGFNGPIYLRSELINFLRRADFGNIPEKYGGTSVHNILTPLLDKGILTRAILTSLFAIYGLKHLRFNVGDSHYYKTDDLMNETLNDYITVLENEGPKTNLRNQIKIFRRDRFQYVDFQRIMNPGIFRLDEKRPEVDNRLINMLKNLRKVLGDKRESLQK